MRGAVLLLVWWLLGLSQSLLNKRHRHRHDNKDNHDNMLSALLRAVAVVLLHTFLSSPTRRKRQEVERAGTNFVCVIPKGRIPTPRTRPHHTQASKMVPSRKSLILRAVLLAVGLALATGFLVSNPAIPPTTAAARRDATTTVVHAGPTLLPTKPMPATQSAGLGSKFFLPAFLPPWIARDTVRIQVSEDIFFLEQVRVPFPSLTFFLLSSSLSPSLSSSFSFSFEPSQ